MNAGVQFVSQFARIVEAGTVQFAWTLGNVLHRFLSSRFAGDGQIVANFDRLYRSIRFRRAGRALLDQLQRQLVRTSLWHFGIF